MTHPGPHRRGGQRQPVTGGETRHIGLIDRDGGDTEASGREQPAVAEQRRRGQMDDVGIETPQDPQHPRAGHTHRK